MDFGIRRLPTEEDSGQRYHLFDGKDRLRLVADHGSSWLPADEQNRVRFALSGGQVVASLDLPKDKGREKNGPFGDGRLPSALSAGRIHTSYALILEHAVYAILNKYQDKQGRKRPFFTIEADGVTWLAWSETGSDVLLTLYKEVPANLMVVNDPLESGQLDPVGTVNRAEEPYDFSVTLPVHPFNHADLIILALVFLFDQS